MNLTAHAKSTIETKGISIEMVEAVWNCPDVTYPSHRYPGQHKRVGQGLALCCENATGKVVTVFVDRTETPLRADQTDADALAWAIQNGMAVAI